ncbi:hypothetical protein ACQP26_09825 [Micromonospora sp. CA-248089]|uniref:hypothetical protein n=1 Tax=Micromonospora sp. CA-248089 TaxID=3239960 RepID=UPI003D942D82
MKLAHGSSNGRSSSTVYGGHEHKLRHTPEALEDSAVPLTVTGHEVVGAGVPFVAGQRRRPVVRAPPYDPATPPERLSRSEPG